MDKNSIEDRIRHTFSLSEIFIENIQDVLFTGGTVEKKTIYAFRDEFDEDINGQEVLDWMASHFRGMFLDGVAPYFSVLKDFEDVFEAQFDRDMIIKAYFGEEYEYTNYRNREGGMRYWFNLKTGYGITGVDIVRNIGAGWGRSIGLGRFYWMLDSEGRAAFMAKIASEPWTYTYSDKEIEELFYILNEEGITDIDVLEGLSGHIDWREVRRLASFNINDYAEILAFFVQFGQATS